MTKGLWAKLSVSFFDDERIMQVGVEAELLFVRGLAWAKRAGDGTISRGALVRLGLGLSNVTVLADALTAVGLWEATDSGFRITGWDAWQTDHTEVRSKAGTLGNHKRWHRTPVANCDHCVANASQMGSQTDRKNIAEIEKEIEKETPTRSRKATGDFDAWWQTWPKKVAVGAARKAYVKALTVADAQVLLEGAQRVARAWQSMDADRRTYVPYPATWLNQQRWNDEIEGATPATRRVVVDPECRLCDGEGIVKVDDDSNTYAPCRCRKVM